MRNHLCDSGGDQFGRADPVAGHFWPAEAGSFARSRVMLIGQNRV